METLFDSKLGREVVIDDKGNTEPQAIRHLKQAGTLEVVRKFQNGMAVTGLIGLDLVKLLTQDRTYTRGLQADGSISIPLLRGSDKFVVAEPLTQAERDTVYAIYEFERFKRVFVVNIASQYLSVLQQLDQLRNAEQNYMRLIASTRRVRRLADAGRIPEIQVDQSRQDELRASNRWILAQTSYDQKIDSFKILLGLPTDAAVQLDRDELSKLSAMLDTLVDENTNDEASTQPAPAADAPIELPPMDRGNAGPLEIQEIQAIELALVNRLDLRVAVDEVFDFQRKVAVAADALRADLTLLGSASIGERRGIGSTSDPDARMQFNKGHYEALLGLDLPLERTAERNQYRTSLINLEKAVRDAQELEDRIKLEIRNNLRSLLAARESVRIQAQAVQVAQGRVTSTELFLRANRAEVRDVLEAQEDLLSAQNALTAALIQYRVAELEMQRDLAILEVDEKGLWRERFPEGESNGDG